MIEYMKWIRNRFKRYGLKYDLTKLKGPISYIGTEYGGFAVYGDIINSDSIVYSFGIGEDISFDLGLIEKYGCKVYAFDPTPKSLEWLKKMKLPKNFTYKEVGLADKDGMLTFAKPENPSHVSVSAVLDNYKSTDRIELPVFKLSTIMDDLGHQNIDVLKMDIEGCEYCVIKDIINSKIEIKQIMVEFHHRFHGVGYRKTNEAIKDLFEHDYILFSISNNGEEMSFIHRAVLK